MSDTDKLFARLAEADLGALGFRAEDAVDATEAIASLANNRSRLAAVEEIFARLQSNVGRITGAESAVHGFNDRAVPEGGLTSMLALIAVAPDVKAEMLRRGVSEAIAVKSLADLGQQVAVHRMVHGHFGLSTQGWVAENYTGRLFWLGRLQFTVETAPDDLGADEEYVLGIHIPETGPLTPTEVDAAIQLARQVAIPAFPELHIERMVLHSWLLDPDLVGKLGPESNIAQFARRFGNLVRGSDGYRDALFFGFHIEPGTRQIDLDSLPQQTSLQRAIREQLAGDGVHLYSGELLTGDTRTASYR